MADGGGPDVPEPDAAGRRQRALGELGRPQRLPVAGGVPGDLRHHRERVLNGHTFALYGVYDYWRLTGDERAVAVFDGAASTVRRYLPTHFRFTRWASKYSMGCAQPHVKYHQVHTAQNLKLYEMTTSAVFATYAYLLRSDYPAPAVNGAVSFAAGTHVGYTFSSTGAVKSQKTLKLARASGAQASQRVRVTGGASTTRSPTARSPVTSSPRRTGSASCSARRSSTATTRPGRSPSSRAPTPGTRTTRRAT
ncbi:D-glucuronyl C5-epimerase family protein [Micromonospora sp. BRA006-A]|nr:D-glucuronyl C5-epimerase family protein [Micromonospora sp. BRA006-A]